MEQIKVLLIENNPADARLIREALAGARGASFQLEWADRLSAGLERLAAGGIDLVLLDLSLPDSRGLDMLARLSEVPVVVLTGFDDETLAIKALQGGAKDYLIKGQVDSNSLARSIRHAVQRHRLLGSLERYGRGWENIFQSIGHPAAILAPDHRIIAANRALARPLRGRQAGPRRNC